MRTVDRRRSVVEITTTVRHRLWDAVPPTERLTEADIRHRFPAYPPDAALPLDGGPIIHGLYAPFVADRLVDQLNHPECAVAVEHKEFARQTYGDRRWLPCGQIPNGDDSLCARHGGRMKTRSILPTAAAPAPFRRWWRRRS